MLSTRVPAGTDEATRAIWTRRPDWDADVPAARSLAVKLFLVAVFLLPLQLEIDAFKSVVETRLPPGDLLLAITILLAPTTLRFRSQPVAILPLGLILTLLWGTLVALVYAGGATQHTLIVKVGGSLVLASWCLVTITHVRAGHGLRILRVWMLGMTFWGAVAYVDWKYVDFLGFLEAKTSSRFGGMQFDPNNAGAAYAVAVVVMWKQGGRLFTHRTAQAVALGLSVLFLTQTYSRGAYIGVAAAVVVVLAIGRVGAVRWARYALATIAIIGGAFATGLIDDSSAEWERRPDTVSSRSELISDGLERYTDSSGLGIGLGTFRRDAENIIHNTPLSLLVELSVVGVGYFLAMAIVPSVAAMRLRRIRPDLALALLGAHVVMLVASTGIEALYQRQWWVFVGLCAWPLNGILPAPPGTRSSGLAEDLPGMMVDRGPMQPADRS